MPATEHESAFEIARLVLRAQMAQHRSEAARARSEAARARARAARSRSDLVMSRSGLVRSWSYAAMPQPSVVKSLAICVAEPVTASEEQNAAVRELAESRPRHAARLQVLAQIDHARAHIVRDDMARAKVLIREVDQMLGRPGHGAQSGLAEALPALVFTGCWPGSPTAPALTRAELRLLPLLATHLTYRQIGEKLFISRTTVSSQAMSIYRKLGVSSRNEAVARSRALALLAE